MQHIYIHIIDAFCFINFYSYTMGAGASSSDRNGMLFTDPNAFSGASQVVTAKIKGNGSITIDEIMTIQEI